MEGRVALVTGGGQGIGRGIAAARAERGAHVVVADISADTARETAEALVKEGAVALDVTVDVCDRRSVESAVERVTRELGPVEILVNNVGWDDLMPFLDTTEELWDRILDLNFKGTLRMTQTVLPGMLERRFGRVVNIGSDAGRVGSSLESVYSGAKGGIIAFTKTLAREVARHGVTANTVCPGPTDTPALRHFADRQGDAAEKVLSGMSKAIPMNRLAEPADIGAAVAFFASESAGYITGQTLSVSGGLTMA